MNEGLNLNFKLIYIKNLIKKIKKKFEKNECRGPGPTNT